MTFQIALKRYTFYSLFCAFILAVHTEGRMSLLLRQPDNDDDTHTHTYYTDRRAFRFPMLLCCLFSLFEVFCFVSVWGELILMVLLPVWPPYTGPCGSLFFSKFPICIYFQICYFLPLFCDQCVFVPLSSLPCLIPGVSNKMYFQDSFLFCDYLIIN